MIPTRAGTGDIVVVLDGGKVPVVLRPLPLAPTHQAGRSLWLRPVFFVRRRSWLMMASAAAAATLLIAFYQSRLASSRTVALIFFTLLDGGYQVVSSGGTVYSSVISGGLEPRAPGHLHAAVHRRSPGWRVEGRRMGPAGARQRVRTLQR